MSVPFSFQSERGHALISQIVQLYAPFQPHDYVLEGVGALLDGKDLIAITPTGSGKTGYIAYTALVVCELTRHPENYPEVGDVAKRFPNDPLILAICPTNYLEYQMEEKLACINLNVLVINKETKDKAILQGLPDLWTTAVNDTTISILLLSPEQLTSDEFNKILKNDTFCARLYALSIDELHLLLTWGKSFRKCFQQIGFVRSRLPDNIVLMGLTATMRGGTALKSVCQGLGLRNGDYHLIRRSNQRPDIELIFRNVSSPIDGCSFPELQWIVRHARKTIIFCRAISLGNQVHQFLCTYDISLGGDPRTTKKRIREYNSISEAHNQATRQFLQSGECRIVIATSTLAVGVDVEDVEDMIGRIRHRFQETRERGTYRGIVYFNANARKRAQETLDNLGSNSGMDEGLARLYLAKCKTKSIDELYDNPQQDAPCTCPTCSHLLPSPQNASCSCSGCNLKLFIPNVSLPSAPNTSDKPKKRPQISLAMRAHGTRQLKNFRQEIYRGISAKIFMLPPDVIFTDKDIKEVLDKLMELNQLEDVTRLLENLKNEYMIPFSQQLYTQLQDMKNEFHAIGGNKNTRENRGSNVSG
ncbi:P-loop containing nucleoside triphosphate hydrolase protein [Lentinula raphanica]|nr:P-loop containing nucleoside triphosphate hydrolase protein [Lentinula raphanica]